MRLQLPTIIVLCFAVILAITLIYNMGVKDDGPGESVNLQSAEFKMIRTHATEAYTAKDYDKAIALYEDAITMRPENAEVLNDLGATYYAYGLEYAGPSWPSWDSDLEGKTVAEGLDELQMAIKHTESGFIVMNSASRNMAKAIEQKAKELKPTYSPAYHNLGSLLMKIGQTDAAVGYLRQAYDLDPRNKDLEQYLTQFKR